MPCVFEQICEFSGVANLQALLAVGWKIELNICPKERKVFEMKHKSNELRSTLGQHSKKVSLFTRFSAVVSLSALALSPAFAKQVVIEDNGNEGVIGSWLAAGSGCQANSQQQGDVSMLSVKPGEKSDDHQRVTFELKKYRLKPLQQRQAGTNSPNAETLESKKARLLNYARECALRVNVNPPPGKRLKMATASAELELTKGQDAQLLVAASLKVGAETVTQSRYHFKNDESFRYRRQKVDLLPGGSAVEQFPEIDCNAKKIVGVDLTFLTNKKKEDIAVDARLFGPALLELEVTFEDCE